MILGLLLPAWALDGTGARPLPQEGELTDALGVLHPVRPEPEGGSFRLTTELAGRSFTLAVDDAGEASELSVLDGLFGLQLAGGASIGRRVQIGASVPLWLATQGAGSTGAGLGDIRVQVPVALVRPGEGGVGFGLSLVPWLDAPTGDATRFLGRGGFGGGAFGALGYGFGPVRLSANVGLAGAASEPAFGVDDRGRFRFGGAVSWAISERYGLSTELDLEKPLQGAVAGEARLVGRARVAAGFEVNGGGAVGVARGVGTANGRLYLGIGYRFGKRPPRALPVAAAPAPAERPYDVRLRVRDEAGAPLREGTATATRDQDTRTAPLEDGEVVLPLDPGEWTLRVEAPGREAQVRTLTIAEDRFRAVEVDAVLPTAGGDATLALRFEDVEGRPVEAARVRVDGADRGVTGPGGTLVIERIAAGERRVAIEAPGFVAEQELAVRTNASANILVLERPRGAVKLRIRGPEGVVDDAVVRFAGPEELAPAPVGPTGERDLVLTPGRWQVVVSSPGYGLQARDLVIDPDSVELVVIDVILAAIGGDAGLGLRVVDPDGRPVEDAEILLDGRPVGRTSNGGAFAVEGLAEGARRLEVRGARFRPLPAREIELVPGWRDLLVQLDWLPGTVEVVARGPDGPVPDAVIRFSGPATIGPEALGPDGHGWFALTPGTWVAALSSPAFGIQARELHVDADETELLVVDATLRAAEAGPAALSVRVVDADGSPVEDATVRVDGLVVGTTSTGGSLRLEGLQPGKRSVTVSADLHEDATLAAVTLRPGANEAVAKLAWVPGIVRVRALAPDGTPVDALARFYGVEALPPLPLGAEGARSFSLAPGKWTAVLSSADYGLAQREVVVAPGARNATELTLTLAAPPDASATLLVEVLDPDGAPISGARLRLGDQERVLESGAAVLDGLPVGTRRASLTAEGYEPVEIGRVALVAGAQERRFVLKPIPRPLRVVVRGEDGTPIDAQVRLVGPARVAPTTATGGVAELRVRPGAWQVLVSSAEFGAERRDVVVLPGPGPVPLEITLAKSRVEVTATNVLLRQQLRFRFNEAVLLPDSFRVLDELAATLRTDARVARVEIQGHTDAVGTEDYNVALSQRRADAVRDYLVSRGVDPARLLAKGYGTSRPQTANDTEAGRARNRRVQFELVE